MKKVKLLALGLFLISTTTLDAKRIKVNGSILGGSGCEYTFSGWIDMGWNGVNCYNVSVSSSCGLDETFSQDC